MLSNVLNSPDLAVYRDVYCHLNETVIALMSALDMDVEEAIGIVVKATSGWETYSRIKFGMGEET